MDDPDLVRLWAFEARSRLAEGTVAEYSRYVSLLARDMPLRGATTPALRGWLASQGHRWGPSTTAFARRALRAFYAWLADEGLVAENPALGIKPVRQPITPVRVAGDAERDALRDAALTSRDRALVEVLFGTGMRRGEVAAMRMEHLRLADSAVLVPKTKTGRPRVVPVDARGMAALARWLTDRTRMAPTDDSVWLLRPQGVKMAYRRLTARAGVRFSPHDARRGYAVRWLEAGGSETGLQAVAGWSSVAMVQRYVREHQGRLGVEEARRLFG